MAATISKLKLDLDFDSTSINQIQLVLFGFQDSVSSHMHTLLEMQAYTEYASCYVRGLAFLTGVGTLHNSNRPHKRCSAKNLLLLNITNQATFSELVAMVTDEKNTREKILYDTCKLL